MLQSGGQVERVIAVRFGPEGGKSEHLQGKRAS
jgi:hypothetical protein